MNKQKQTYLSPETETLVVRFEGAIMHLSGGALGDPGIAGAILDNGNSHYYDDDLL